MAFRWVKFIELVSCNSLGEGERRKNGDEMCRKSLELDTLSYRVLEVVFMVVDARMIPVEGTDYASRSLRPRTFCEIPLYRGRLVCGCCFHLCNGWFRGRPNQNDVNNYF
ncbi:hypothetical protein AAHA92_11397 [Salvia divinorum]|uniref:Uncharacterized protein n=1 Tax=Salvia divinorum TaxID=28513 RepID=A0ABD1HGV7_SALDI